MGKSQKTGNTAVSGISSADSGHSEKETYIQAYIESAYKGASAEEATAAARAAAMPDYNFTDIGNTKTSALTGIENSSAGRYANRVMGQTKATPSEQSYADRVIKTTAQNQWENSRASYSPAWKQDESETDTDIFGTTVEATSDSNDRKTSDTVDPYVKDHLKSLLSGVTAVNVAPKDDGDTKGQQETVTESYRYPEEGDGLIHYSRSEPFSDEEKQLIDRINEATEAGDEDEADRLMKLYSEGKQGTEKLKYTDSLPEGTEEYQPLDDAYTSGNRTQYAVIRDEMISSGYDEDEIADHTAERIREAYTGQTDGKIDREQAEKELREYVGLTEADAHATTAWWWFDSFGGKSRADTNGNGKLTLEEIGVYCTELIDTGEIDEEQAAAIFDKAKPVKSKKNYSEWLAGYKKGT